DLGVVAGEGELGQAPGVLDGPQHRVVVVGDVADEVTLPAGVDHHRGHPVGRLRVPGASVAPWQDRVVIPAGPVGSRRWPGSGRPGVRREYDHQPDAPAARRVARCAFAAVRDITGRMLLVRRCDTGDWELPGGQLDPGAV